MYISVAIKLQTLTNKKTEYYFKFILCSNFIYFTHKCTIHYDMF